MRAPILDQPSISVPDGYIEKDDRYRGDDGPVWTVGIVDREKRVDDCDIGFDEADAVVGECCLRGAVDGLLRLGTEVLHHCDPPLQKVASRLHVGSIFGEYGCSELGILLNERFGKGICERANGRVVSTLAGTRRAGRTDAESACETRDAETLHQTSTHGVGLLACRVDGVNCDQSS